MKQDTNPYGKFKIALEGFASRVVVIPENITLWQMHRLIQVLFGWEDYHLWGFEDFEGHRFGPPPFDEDAIPECEEFSPGDACLADVLPARGIKLKYTYDFGDDWRHVVTRLATPKVNRIECVKSEGPDGVEDSGGWFGEKETEDKVPTSEEITRRMATLDLTPLPSKTGLLEREQAARKELICSLDDREWRALCYLGEDEEAEFRPVQATERLSQLPDFMPDLFCFQYTKKKLILGMRYSFRRYWRKNKPSFLAWRENMPTGRREK